MAYVPVVPGDSCHQRCQRSSLNIKCRGATICAKGSTHDGDGNRPEGRDGQSLSLVLLSNLPGAVSPRSDLTLNQPRQFSQRRILPLGKELRACGIPCPKFASKGDPSFR